MLAQEHPDMFAEAVRYEQKHSDGRTYTWTQGETLMELLGRKSQIISDHKKAVEKQISKSSNQSLADILTSILDGEDDTLPCLACHL